MNLPGKKKKKTLRPRKGPGKLLFAGQHATLHGRVNGSAGLRAGKNNIRLV